ncbi:MAG: hypothetical protein JKP98_25405 [Rhodobacteraceae bacterium]|jgi:hypothetical protein|nr:hypothetical protein [Paracoccaceae bacterium]MBL4559177.1 hypothetical protein [Paracoccaceae bacterium]
MITRSGPHFDPLPGLNRRMARLGLRLASGDVSIRLYALAICLACIAFGLLLDAFLPAAGPATPLHIGPRILGLPLIAIGGVATGWIAIGGLAVGVVAIGGGAFGVISLGGLALGLALAVGGGAVGYYANGGLAVGGYAYAGNGVAFGRFQAQGNQHEALIGR